MNNCIDIFSRLLIATITFIVPIIINLLSTFSAGEKRRKELAKETEDKISKQAAEEVQNYPEKIKETINKTTEEYKKADSKTKEELSRLNPITQFWIIFIYLSLSFVFVIFSFLIRSNTWNLYNHNLSIASLLFSAITYLTAIYYIIRILYTISNTKKITEQN